MATGSPALSAPFSRRLEVLFHPRSVAVVGASTKEHKLGYIAVRNLILNSFEGPVFAINPKHTSVSGLLCYPGLYILATCSSHQQESASLMPLLEYVLLWLWLWLFPCSCSSADAFIYLFQSWPYTHTSTSQSVYTLASLYFYWSQLVHH